MSIEHNGPLAIASIGVDAEEAWWYHAHVICGKKLTLSIVLLGLIAAPALVHGSSEVKEESADAKFFLKSYQTTTVTTLSVVLTTVPYFCAVTTTAAGSPPPPPIQACTGRNLRRKRRLSIRDKIPEKSVQLEESIEEVPQAVKEDKNERLFFTLWQSTTTTLTVTSTLTNTSITISASALCTFANYNVPLC
ncbi:uncharacterized protein LOC135203994 [Macrobrachium nipponense]|uniref:uncharacterized protein LOC135203994 n=1 Tax=Macrobrachium nipponense TaxID=159736 RepID=UPI0030C82C01